MIHDPSVSATQLAGPFWSSGDWHVDFRYRLILNAIAPEAMEAKGRDRLKEVGPSRHAEDALEGLLDSAREFGLSDDGAILLVATRSADRQ